MSLLHKFLGSGRPSPVTYVEDVFSTYLYTGTGATQTITNGIDLTGEGGLVWFKRRSAATEHTLYDTERGVNFSLSTNLTSANINKTGDFSSFNNNGFTIGVPTVSNDIQSNTATYASWTFRKAPRFFDVVTWTGDGVVDREIAHGLGVAPGMILVKNLTTATNWPVYHRSLPSSNDSLLLNLTAAKDTTGYFTTTTPTDTKFTVSNSQLVNDSGDLYVAYLFADDPLGGSGDGSDGMIACGSVTGSGNTTPVPIALGWEPQYLMVKPSSGVGSWLVVDMMRGWTNVTNGNTVLYPNGSTADDPGNWVGGYPTATGVDFLGAASQTYIYMAIRRPMKTPEVGTEVYNAIERAGSASVVSVTGVGFTPDLYLKSELSRLTWGQSATLYDRLRGFKYLNSQSTAAEGDLTPFVSSFDMDGMTLTNSGFNGSGATYINHFFKRAKGFFDVVTYTGDSIAGRTVAHSLGVVPEMMIVKFRGPSTLGSGAGWIVYHSGTSIVRGQLGLNSDAACGADNVYNWNNTSPTNSVFSVGGAALQSNYTTGTYIAYLFATLAGISKVGSYTGDGAAGKVIDCGFSTGARFILIKRTDSTGDWFIWDTVRGIVAGNDPHLSLNTTTAEVTTDDSIDADTSGFIVNQDAATDINVTSATYIFLAIA